MPDNTIDNFERYMMERQKIGTDLQNANFATNLSTQQKQDLITWVLSCQSIKWEDLDRFYAFVSEEVKTANLDDRAFELCRIYRLQAENYWVMAIPNRYHQDLSSCPEKYVIAATQDACFRETLRKTIQLLQLTKGRNGKYIDAMFTNKLSITSSTPEQKSGGGFWSLFKGK